MKIPLSITVALLGVLGSIIGYIVSNVLELSRAARLREMDFKLNRYTDFLLAYGEASSETTFETQSRFANSVNVILLIGGPDLLEALKKLVENFNDPDGTVEKQVPILERIV